MAPPRLSLEGLHKAYGDLPVLDGVSLTVKEVDGDAFGVNIIPHTAAVTTFSTLQPGSLVNIEIDTLARYVARLKDATA